jgi:predicted NBD/HSP70 family sugar kinase
MVSVHEMNRSKILQTLFLHAPISRIEIANIMSLTPPTITTNISLLVKEGIVKEISEDIPKGESVVGRKPIMLDIVSDSYFAAGVDWGPNGIICVLTDLRGRVIDRVRVKNEKWEPDATISRTAKLIAKMTERNKIPKEKILGVGVGVPGFIETETGVIRYSPAHGWQNVPAGKHLEEQTGLNVAVENNVRVMATGKILFSEHRQEDEKEDKSWITGDFIYIFVGLGIGCAIAHNNELLRGAVFGAGELGHTTVALNGPRCRCGKRGCLEAIAGEHAITGRMAGLIRKKGAPILKELAKNPDMPKISEILAAFDNHDRDVEPALLECIEYLAVGVANVINLVNPKLVIFDGQMFTNRRFCRDLEERINDHTFWLMRSETPFKFEQYNEDFCAISGAAAAIKHFLF